MVGRQKHAHNQECCSDICWGCVQRLVSAVWLLSGPIASRLSF